MIEKETCMAAWKKALSDILDGGEDFEDENNRICRELFNLKIIVKNPSKELTYPIEVLNGFKQWKYPPLEEMKKVMLTNKLAPDYAYSYGPRLFNFQDKINQVDDFIIPLLKKFPNSRRAVLSFWDPRKDSNIFTRDNPALVVADFKLRKGKLNMTTIIRSNDMFFGWPANFYQVNALQEYICKRLGCKEGSITTISTSAHIFEDQFEYIRFVLKNK